MRDLISSLNLKPAIVPVASAGTDNTASVSTILDRMGYEGVALAIITGTLADADATFAVTMEHGDVSNLSDAAAVPADQMNGGLAAAGFNFGNDSACRKVGYVGGKRYVRATVTPSGNSGAAPIAAMWLLSRANLGPMPNPPA